MGESSTGGLIPEDRGLRLLSLGTCFMLTGLDGGGIRGLSSLIIVEELMECIKWKARLDSVPIPADYFDPIGGTSTGG